MSLTSSACHDIWLPDLPALARQLEADTTTPTRLPSHIMHIIYAFAPHNPFSYIALPVLNDKSQYNRSLHLPHALSALHFHFIVLYNSGWKRRPAFCNNSIKIVSFLGKRTKSICIKRVGHHGARNTQVDVGNDEFTKCYK